MGLYPPNVISPAPAPPIKRHRSLLIPLVLIIAVLVGAAAFLLFAPAGQKILNRFLPSAERTLQFAQDQLASAGSYSLALTIERGDTKTQASGLVVPPANFDWEIQLLADNAKSNVHFPDRRIMARVRVSDDAVYVEDPYNGTYSPADDCGLPVNQIETFRQISPLSVLTWANKNSPNAQISKDVPGEASLVSVSIPGIPDQLSERFGDASASLRSSQASFLIDPKTNEIRSFRLEWQNAQEKTTSANVTLTSYDDTASGSIPTTEPNKYGDFIARESVYLRTNPEGKFDYLFPKWEQEFFQCSGCVNKYWDEDGDGLSNVQEFIFGSNPNRPDTDANGISDADEIIQHASPANSRPLTEPYDAAIFSLLLDPMHQLTVEDGLDDKVGKADFRHGVTQIGPLNLPPESQSLGFNYALMGQPTEGPDFTVFFNNVLLFSAEPAVGEVFDANNQASIKWHHASVSLEKVRGQTGNLYFIYNSYGPPGGEMVVDTASILLFEAPATSPPPVSSTPSPASLALPSPTPSSSPTPAPATSSPDDQVKSDLRQAQQLGSALPAEQFGSNARISDLLHHADKLSGGGLTTISGQNGFCASMTLAASKDSWCIDATTPGVADKHCDLGQKTCR